MIRVCIRHIETDPKDRCFLRIDWKHVPQGATKHYGLNAATYGTGSPSYQEHNTFQKLAIDK